MPQPQLHLTVLPAQPQPGTRVLLAFHGIGQTGPECYSALAQKWKDRYTVYAFDLYFHGEQSSDLPIEAVNFIRKTELIFQIEQVLQQQGIERFDVIGFSMGGRFAMAILEAFAYRIDKAFLIAPDGISEHPVYHLATRNAGGRYILRRQMERPRLFFATVKGLQKIGIVNKSLVRFAEQIMNTRQKRLTLYNAWVGFRHMRFNIPKWYEQVAQHATKVYLIVGEYDKLLKPSAVKTLANLLPPDQFIIVSGGHTTVVDKAAAYLGKNGIV
ncbi:alpha/beta fold hydrolase [Dyadobacter tibetensis]|uniref:alpha/beta fold hydrolase n=1 Tax=Dyadobacter tibetensis TaxID=1211851 RepID=UPI00046E73E1|nr:alpha/beta fold hydrolase [Dyadobacter tibetensis]